MSFSKIEEYYNESKKNLKQENLLQRDLKELAQKISQKTVTQHRIILKIIYYHYAIEKKYDLKTINFAEIETPYEINIEKNEVDLKKLPQELQKILINLLQLKI